MPELQNPFCRGAVDIAAGLRELEILTGSETFNWRGAEVLCVARSLMSTTQWDVGGLVDNSTDRLYVRRGNFLTADSTLVTVDSELWTADSDMPVPVSGKTITFRGKLWRINSAREGATRAHLELDIGSPDK